jgi:transposase
MPPPAVDDQLWELIQPLLPRETRRFRHPGRRQLDNRKVLNGILFVLITGIARQRLPRELSYGSGMTGACVLRLSGPESPTLLTLRSRKPFSGAGSSTRGPRQKYPTLDESVVVFCGNRDSEARQRGRRRVAVGRARDGSASSTGVPTSTRTRR